MQFFLHTKIHEFKKGTLIFMAHLVGYTFWYNKMVTQKDIKKFIDCMADVSKWHGENKTMWGDPYE